MGEQPPQNHDQESLDFFQKPSFNAKERLICSHLIECVNAEPLEVVLHTAQAALLLDDGDAKKLDIDQEEALILFTVAQRMKQARDVPEMSYSTLSKGDAPTYNLSISSLDYERAVEPWIRGTYTLRLYSDEKEKMDTIQDEGDPQEIYTHALLNLHARGFNKLVSDFLFYALPMAQTVGGKLTTIISPDTYVELFKVMRGEHPSR